VEKSIDAGAGAIVIITAGFKEVDKAGAALEKRLWISAGRIMSGCWGRMSSG